MGRVIHKSDQLEFENPPGPSHSKRYHDGGQCWQPSLHQPGHNHHHLGRFVLRLNNDINLCSVYDLLGGCSGED